MTISNQQKKEIRDGVSGSLNKTYEDAEFIVDELKKENIEVKNYAIDVDLAVKDGYTILIPVNGMVGNYIFRTLLLCGGKILIATLFGLSRFFEDNSRNEKDFTFHIKWITALINKKKHE